MRETKMILVLRKDLNMRKGKMVSQGSHAVMKFIVDQYLKGSDSFTVNLTEPEKQWLSGLFTKVTCSVSSEQELLDLIAKAKTANVKVKEIIDAGKTEFKGVPTLTCAAFGPDYCDVLDPITGHLPLL